MNHHSAPRFVAINAKALKRALSQCTDDATIIIPLDTSRNGCLGDVQLNRRIADEILEFDDCDTQLHLRYGEVRTTCVKDSTDGEVITILTIK